ncbi:hypothetical protein PJM25_29075, partial [Mycobacterium kansasii]
AECLNDDTETSVSSVHQSLMIQCYRSNNGPDACLHQLSTSDRLWRDPADAYTPTERPLQNR